MRADHGLAYYYLLFFIFIFLPDFFWYLIMAEIADEFSRSIMAVAADWCRQDQTAEETKHGGLLLPCRNVPPLQPPLTLREYEMMERDRGKYLLYYAAIKRSLQGLAQRLRRTGLAAEPHSQLDSPLASPAIDTANDEDQPAPKRAATMDPVKIVVVGPGGGRLVR